MNKEDIKNAIDLIEPDPYMETRLKAKSIPKKRCSGVLAKAVSGILALCLVFAVMFGFNQPLSTVSPITEGQTETSRQNMRQINPFIMVASAMESENDTTEKTYNSLALNEAFPFVYKLSVIDTRAMSESEKQKEIKRLSKMFESTVINESSGRFESAYGVLRGGFENIIFTEVMFNKIVLDIKEENLKLINVKNSSEWGYIEYDAPINWEEAEKTGMITVLHGKDLTVTAENYNSSNGFIWRNSDKLDNAINDNPDMPLSTFKDTITFTVEYTDGTKEIGVIDVTFDDDGNGAFTLKEYKEG